LSENPAKNEISTEFALNAENADEKSAFSAFISVLFKSADGFY
jgi:hypothetical protein